MSTNWSSPWFVYPGSYHQRFYSGALLAPHPDSDEKLQRESLGYYEKISRQDPAAGIKPTPITEYYDDRAHNAPIWYRNLYPDFRFLPTSSLPATARIGFRYTGFTVNPNDFLPWLVARLRSLGVDFIQATISSLDELRALTRARILVNASGLGARELAKDGDVMGVRGQTMFVKCDYKQVAILQGSEYTYAIPRISAGGVILGGVSQVSNDTTVDQRLKKDILRRVNRITGNAFDWVNVERDVQDIVGFRPSRRGGIRVEKEGDVVHAYGGGSLGYVYAFGMASRVRDLISGGSSGRPKL
ncbi:D-amino-acid oxidase [Lasiodiplodia hormozganensis]|uniref:D-amino-acid oxidase n=1 Tax=Lasiodiplodia hormozganensis TaxID=869390 RepID=A0AA39YLD2_9PEZI|nr:D-amino-acid oxidase [Lasiodiplodia hormozganensis]